MFSTKIIVAAMLAVVSAQAVVNYETGLDGAIANTELRAIAGVDGVPEDDDVLPEGSNWFVARSVNVNMTATHDMKSGKAKTSGGGRSMVDFVTIGTALVVAAAAAV
ncbi:protein of unknown function [Taphrina deformans PYCC 5710]|uniref:GPI anchored protein n=1 Tax=Taphrina deformans (strain PYCC 5710 / ATCC 11124 / CBS 356.35 / IMI 108563 / JCM 9778 / NBRC 8474) TaxID=1097556 RepID=R4XNU9_TAPDE|nr:protein of unknown function [Taphrina deformans PYCC 5710]|eukprot:CCG84940.1 protein of unknown function [Taphrina deformans PYCC 5710]